MDSLIYYRHNSFGDVNPIPEEKIYYNDLTIVLKGTFTYLINGRKTVLNSGDAIFIKSGELRKRLQAEPCDYVSFNFITENTPDFPTFISDTVNSEIELLIAVCDGVLKKHTKWSDKIMSVANTILIIIKDKLNMQELNPLILEIMRFLNYRIGTKTTLSDVAKKIGYSKNYCDAIFKKETGVSIIDYFLQERIDEAKRLILEGILPLTQIALNTGFEDYNYFSRIFKKRTGYSPSDYKKITFNSK